MGKIIKKKVERSFPWLVSLCLLGTLMVGFSFNLTFDFIPGNDRGLISMSQEAQADTATTTVEVMNAAPYFANGFEPEEDPASASSSPVNIGGSIDFKGTGTDPEGDDYWLLICTSDSATSTIGSAPSCGGTQLCVSNKASSTVEASCTYSNLTDPGSETQVWYGFVCDDHNTSPRCSLSDQGVGTASGSPVYVNHHPILTTVNTTVDNQAPGGTFTIQGNVTDSDTSGGADELTMYVCATSSFSIAGGCAGAPTNEICSGTSNSPNVSCQYTDTAPTPDAAYTYYAFVYDWHELQATNTITNFNTYTIINVSPEIGAGTVTLNGGTNIGLNIKNATEVSINTLSTSITDQNGCTDLVGATSTIYLSGVAGAAGCAANDNDCYQIASCVLSACTGDTDPTATYTCTTDMAFHTIPTNTGDYSAQSWYSRITAYDEAYSTSSDYNTLNGVEVLAAAALDVTQAIIDYGIVESNNDTGAVNAATTIVNFGNTPLETELEGEDLQRVGGGGIIEVQNQEYATSSFTYSTGIDLVASSSYVGPALQAGLVSPRPTNQTNVEDVVYWGIAIPLGTVSGNYEAYNTFTATVDNDGNENWN